MFLWTRKIYKNDSFIVLRKVALGVPRDHEFIYVFAKENWCINQWIFLQRSPMNITGFLTPENNIK